ncbi:hypothetical protein H0H93_002223 [Arthromyces matolae]|nr:hypothetical protein H0H93_002223 [Arthromyces matolae]
MSFPQFRWTESARPSTFAGQTAQCLSNLVHRYFHPQLIHNCCKTTVMQQIIALAIFSACIIFTSGTPLPASLLPARQASTPFPHSDLQLVTDHASSTEFNLPHTGLIVPRADLHDARGAPPPGTINDIMKVLTQELKDHERPEAERPVWAHPTQLEYFLQTVLDGYGSLASRQNDPQFPSLRLLVAEAMRLGCQDLLTAVLNPAIAGITEDTGEPLIKLLIKMADLTIYHHHVCEGHDFADIVEIAVKRIMEHCQKQQLKWSIINDPVFGLEKAQTDLENKAQLRIDAKPRT